MKRSIAHLLITLFLVIPAISYGAPENFRQAKIELKNKVYYDQAFNGALGTTYCGCNWRWVGESGGRTDLASCGYKIRSPQSDQMTKRAERTEWEHVVTAHTLGKQRQCWQKGGRTNCNRTDSIFNAMEANMHNLTPIIGEVNADRSNFNLGMVSGGNNMYGQCASKTDFKSRTFEPRDEAKGMTARIHFYMHDRYNLSMSKQQQQLFMAWNKQFPVTKWERERDRRIAKVMGHSNPFVTGERTWTLGHRNSGDGLTKSNFRPTSAQPNHSGQGRSQSTASLSNDKPYIRGNKNSKIYHLPHCPNYKDISERNQILFNDESSAITSGYRKARNCN
jgi:deoxyribonuclease-1